MYRVTLNDVNALVVIALENIFGPRVTAAILNILNAFKYL